MLCFFQTANSVPCLSLLLFETPTLHCEVVELVVKLGLLRHGAGWHGRIEPQTPGPRWREPLTPGVASVAKAMGRGLVGHGALGGERLGVHVLSWRYRGDVASCGGRGHAVGGRLQLQI